MYDNHIIHSLAACLRFPEWQLRHPLHKSVSVRLVVHLFTPLTTINSLTAVIVSRFLLNLQAANQRAIAHDSDPYYVGSAPDTLHTLVFERVIGSIASEGLSLWEASSTDAEPPSEPGLMETDEPKPIEVDGASGSGVKR